MGTNQKSLLFITTQLPYPPKSGGTVKSWNYIKDLAQRYDLSLATLLKDDDADYVEALKEKISFHHFLAEKHQTARSAKTLLNSYLGFPCLNVFRNYSPAFYKKVQDRIHESDMVIIDHYEVFQYVPNNYKGKVILHTHNAEFMLWRRLAELENNPLKKLLLKMEAKRVAKYEQSIFDRSDLIFTTESDQELYHKHGFKLGNVETTYHLGNEQLLDLEDLNFSDTELALCFMGTLSWEPNIDGLIWFLKEVWPLLKKEFPQLKFYILGKDPDQRIKTVVQEDPHVIFTGFVKNLDDYLKKTRVYLAPLRFGSGMKVKVLEGLYRGVPTVSTSVGAEGLKVEDGKHIMIADQAEEFASKCIQLLQNETLWNTIKKESRILADKQYRWAPLFDRMDQSVKKLI